MNLNRMMNEFKQNPSEKTEEKIRELKNVIHSKIFSVVNSMLDFPCAIFFASESKIFRPGFIYLFGAISSLMGGYTAFPK
mmetsp:Transcript_7868/g.7118  ORF Transcript_7868/g.7118 Transcript_7868/m.7118 type:complete len:80 (+) Transcript_7868:550-789(+)